MVDRIERTADGLWRGRFTAMACPCEILVDAPDAEAAREAVRAGADEARRIEAAFSRYRNDNLIHAINTAGGEAVQVDAELAALLDYADQCHRLSEGLFDITCGVLRRAWRFDGGHALPSDADVDALRALVGWDKAEWRSPWLRLPAGMEIDLGGLGKEYAVDRALLRIGDRHPALVNFGGDLAVNGPRADGDAWRVALENPLDLSAAAVRIRLSRGAVATSGDSRRFILAHGRRYGHILDPRSGRPVADAPRSVTVVGDRCLEAGLFSTLAMLQGAAAEDFLRQQEIEHWIFR